MPCIVATICGRWATKIRIVATVSPMAIAPWRVPAIHQINPMLTSEALKTNKRFVSCLASGGKAGKHRYAVQRSSMLASTLLESPDVKE